MSHSKIHDKESHLEALERYRKICQDEESIYKYELKCKEKRKNAEDSNVAHHINSSSHGSNSNSNNEGNGDGNSGSDKDNKNPSSSSTNATNTLSQLAQQV